MLYNMKPVSCSLLVSKLHTITLSLVALYCLTPFPPIQGVQSHLLRPYLEYVGYVYQKMDPLPEQEQFEVLKSLSED